MSRLIGIFGGTFDPIHLGHLQSIKLLDDTCDFDLIHWVLSARPPHKDQVSATIEHRFAMLQLALQELPTYLPDDTEISRNTASYTFDTVQQFRHLYSQDTLCLIIGGDSLQKLHTWYRYDELIDLVHLVVMHRPGYDFEVPDYLKERLVKAKQLSDYHCGKLVLFNKSEFDISSTELRQTIMQEFPTKSMQSLVQQYIAEPVIEYIHQHRLYRNSLLYTSPSPRD